jgi:hypothetical protein
MDIKLRKESLSRPWTQLWAGSQPFNLWFIYSEIHSESSVLILTETVVEGVGFEVFTVVIARSSEFRYTSLCGPLKIDRRWETSVFYQPHAVFFLRSLFNPEDVGDKFLQIFVLFSTDCTSLYPRRYRYLLERCFVVNFVPSWECCTGLQC